MDKGEGKASFHFQHKAVIYIKKTKEIQSTITHVKYQMIGLRSQEVFLLLRADYF